MKLNHNIQIDLLEVFRSGKFEFIKPGQTKAWILNNFPDPDDYEAGKTLQTANFWKYGNIDFFFHEDRLTQIFTDYIDSVDGGENINIQKWIFDKPKTLSVQFVIQSLVRERISFLIRHHLGEHICQTSIGLINSCVHLNFQPADSDTTNTAESNNSVRKCIDPNTHQLCSITIMDNEEFKTAYNTSHKPLPGLV